MTDYNQTFGYTQDHQCLDANDQIVGTKDNHAFGFEPDPVFLPVEPTCDERKKGFICTTPDFIKKFNWLSNAWEKGIKALGDIVDGLQTQIDNIASLSVGLDNQIPYVNSAGDDLEYDTTLFYDHDQRELNTENVTTFLGDPTIEVLGANNTLTNPVGDTVVVGASNIVSVPSSVVVVGQNVNVSGHRTVAVGADVIAGAGTVAVGESTQAADQSVACGYRSKALGGLAIAVGSSANASGSSSMAIGWLSKALTAHSQAWGRGSIAGVYTNAECVIGSADGNGDIDYFYLGHGVEKSSTTPDDVYVRATGGLGTDKPGFSMHLQGGASTGAGEGGKLYLGTAQAGAAGTARRVPVDMWSVNPDGNLEALIDGAGFVLKSPDGLTTKTITLDNAGALVVS